MAERKAGELNRGDCATFRLNGKNGTLGREFFARVEKKFEVKQPLNPSLKVQILKWGYVQGELVLGGGTEVIL